MSVGATIYIISLVPFRSRVRKAKRNLIQKIPSIPYALISCIESAVYGLQNINGFQIFTVYLLSIYSYFVCADYQFILLFQPSGVSHSVVVHIVVRYILEHLERKLTK